MSLVGSLEDLGLGDILQIISLSGKSGVLVIRTESGEGQILFDQGLLRGAFTTGGPNSLRELLGRKGSIPEPDLEAAWQDAHSRGGPLVEVLQERGLADEDALDALRRENIEAAVFEMFAWSAGEFSFEVRDLEISGEELFLSPGVNPQFLALEGTRRVDEQAWGGDEEVVFDGEDAALPSAEASATESPTPSPEASPTFVDAPSPEFAQTPSSEASPTLVDAPAAEVWAESAGSPGEEELLFAEPMEEGEEEALEAVALAEPETLIDVVAEPAADGKAPPAVVREEPAPTAPAGRIPPLVVIDGDLILLEWLKEALEDVFPRIHIFQRSDLGVHRIRQYLGRAEVPLVVIAADAPADPVTGAKGSAEIVQRLKKLAPRMPVWMMVEAGSEAPPTSKRGPRPDGVVEKPTPTHLADPRAQQARESLAAAMQESLRNAGPAIQGRANDPKRALARLKEAHSRISDPASRGDVLRQVLSFASQSFARVALFMVREEKCLGIAQVGLAKAGGPDEGGLRELHLDAREPGWFRHVMEGRGPYRGGPLDEGDQHLALMLGNDIPEEVWVAPIQSADRVVAILYGDNLPAGDAIGDTGALEVVVDSAGMALDRAFLETLAGS